MTAETPSVYSVRLAILLLLEDVCPLRVTNGSEGEKKVGGKRRPWAKNRKYDALVGVVRVAWRRQRWFFSVEVKFKTRHCRLLESFSSQTRVSALKLTLFADDCVPSSLDLWDVRAKRFVSRTNNRRISSRVEKIGQGG